MRFSSTLRSLCEDILRSGESLDLLVLSHVDDDHIGGILRLLRQGWECPFVEVGMNHAGMASHGDSPLSVRQNDEVYSRLVSQGVRVSTMLAGCRIDIGGGFIDVLSPHELAAYEREGDVPLGMMSDRRTPLSVLEKADIIRRDRSVNNKNSVVFTFEFEGRRILLTGDAWSKNIVSSLTGGVHKFDLVKLPHHGSVANMSEEYASLIYCEDFLICADGRSHPDKQTIAKLASWYGRVNVYSPTDWWSQDFFIPEDDRTCINLVHKEGLVIAW